MKYLEQSCRRCQVLHYSTRKPRSPSVTTSFSVLHILNDTHFLLLSLQGSSLKTLIVQMLALPQKHLLSHPSCARSRVYSLRKRSVTLKPKRGINRPHNRQKFAHRDFLSIVFTNYILQAIWPDPFRKSYLGSETNNLMAGVATDNHVHEHWLFARHNK